MSLGRREVLQSLAVGGASASGTWTGAKAIRGVASLLVAFSRYQTYVTPDDAVIRRLAASADVAGGNVDLPGDDEVEYVTDGQQFLAVDHWQKPREYYRNSFRGDCEDYALFFASLFAAKGLDARFVIGTLDDGGHALAEVERDGDYVVTSVGEPKDVIPRAEFARENDWEPVAMFGNDASLQPYESDW